MSKLDLFTEKRLKRWLEEFRKKTGQLPTLRDLSEGGFTAESVKLALKGQVLEEFYVTLSNGSVVKGYKLHQD
jgi:hypothetical protein